MARYKVILEYDGSEFQGFQRQANARTVQGEVESALRHLSWQGGAVLAAGRTDTGVHASGQVIAFDLDWAHTGADLQRALNAHLPVDVAARALGPVEDGFHPRYNARARRYRYRLFTGEVRQPLRERYAWRVWPGVVVEWLQHEASALQGTHDFDALGSAHRAGGSTVREIYQAGWMVEGYDLVFEIVGNAFLYHMVRRLVSLQVEIGQGKIPGGSVVGYLKGKESTPYQGLAPPNGLVLAEVIYPS